MMRNFGRIVAASAALVVAFSDPIGSQQPVSEASLRGHAVQVVNRGTKTMASSGFVYLTSDLVVTALHSVLGGGELKVYCKGEIRNASLEKVLPKADLALLRMSGNAFRQCHPVQEAQVFKERPPERSALTLAGSYQNANITTREVKLQSMDPPENLRNLLRGEAFKLAEMFKVPSVDLPIFYVQGGLLPGYSGAPVFDLSGRLVGIADGGLNRGADSYNWIVPASNLTELMGSPAGAVPSGLTNVPEQMFSATVVDDNFAPSGTGTSAGRPAGAVFVAGTRAGDPPKAHWIKRLSAAQLMGTSDDPSAFNALRQAFLRAGGDATFDMNRQFDIYQEAGDGMIFAAPANWWVEYRQASGSYSVNDPRHADPRFGPTFSTNRFEIRRNANTLMAGDGSGPVRPSDPRYFQETVDEAVAGVAHPDTAPSHGAVLAGSMRRFEFADGNKVMKFATLEEGTLGYQVWAVQGDNVSSAEFLDFAAEDDQNFLTVVFALNLITFHNAGGKRSAVSEFRTDYVPGFTDPSTKWAAYDDEARSRMPQDPAGPPIWRFFHKRGKLWEVPSDEYWRLGPNRGPGKGPDTFVFTEVDRRQGLVYLRTNNIQYAVPVIGGTYHISRDGGQFQPVGVIRRRPQ